MILGIIPARAGSKRLPGKNLKPLGGKPLISHIIDASLKSSLIDKVVVTTDSEMILKVAQDYSEIISIKRPADLASDTSPAIDYVKHTISSIDSKISKEIKVIVILQPTSPFTLAEDIDNTIKLLLGSGADSAVSMVKLDHMVNPLKLKVMNGDKVKPYLEDENGRMEHSSVPEVYVRNCSIYATTIETINQGIVIGDDCRGYVMPRERSLDINDEFDLKLAEFMYESVKKDAV